MNFVHCFAHFSGDHQSTYQDFVTKTIKFQENFGLSKINEKII